MCCSSRLNRFLKTFFVLFTLGMSGVCEQVVHSIGGKVGGGNFTHYTLKQEGTVSLILDSTLGDADIYISESNSKPDYMDYDLQSATYGQDVVTVPKEFKRPIGIGIFGHVYHPISKYVLTVVLDYNLTSSASVTYVKFYNEEDIPSESTLWVIFVNIMKIILEVLV